MNQPTNCYKKIYIIFPLDENGKAIGAYVGRTWNIRERLKRHYHNKKDAKKQNELHELMRTNNYICLEVDSIPTCMESYLENDWMDLCQNVLNLRLFNNQVGKGDYRRIGCVIQGEELWKK